jgi:hypothetical protein
MTGARKHGDPGNDLEVSLDFPDSRPLVIEPLPDGVAGLSSGLELGALHHNLGMCERPVVATMIKVEVRVDDRANVGRGQTACSQQIENPPSYRLEPFFDEAVALTHTRVDQDRPTIRFDEIAVHADSIIQVVDPGKG